MSSSSIEVESESSSRFYTWRQENWVVHYETKGSSKTKPPLLLLPGFGVGTFYYQAQLEELSKDYRVFTMDLLGQGKSWPEGEITKEQQLCYSTDLWVEQVIDFITDIVGGEQVHVFGNSLGGYLATHAAATRPDLFASLILANAAPFWAFAPPHTGESDGGLFSLWNGTLPAPEPIFNFGSAYFDIIRSRPSVQTMLKGVYHNDKAFDDKLVQDIITSASHPNGYEAFTSILFSPKTERSFDDALKMVREAGRPVLLVYGKNDPWVVPYWGQRAYKALTKGCEGEEPVAHYVEIANCGHSPNHEAPKAVNSVLGAWLDCLGSLPPSFNGPEANRVIQERLAQVCGVTYQEDSGSAVEVSVMDGKPKTLPETLFSFFDDIPLV